MAQVKLMKIDTDGVLVEMSQTADDITLNSYTIQGGGPVLSGTGLDLNNTNVSEIDDLSFNDATSTITNQEGSFEADDLMFDSRENVMESTGAVLFPVITDTADEVDSFRLPSLAGAPSAVPADGGEGFLVWNSTANALYVWDGAAWQNTSIVEEASRVCAEYTAGEAIAIGEVVYISAADTVSLADASGGGAPSRVVGMAGTAAALALDPVKICSEGVISGLAGLTAGDRYYADPATPGAITTTVPVGSGNTIVQIGYAKSATEIHLQIDQLGRRS